MWSSILREIAQMVLMVESKLNWNWNSIEEGTPAPVTQATCPANAAEFRGERVSGFGFRVSGPALMWSGAFVVFVLGKFYFSRFIRAAPSPAVPTPISRCDCRSLAYL